MPILFAEITYSFYPVYAALFNTTYRLIPVDDEFNVLPAGYYQEKWRNYHRPIPMRPLEKGISGESIEDI